MSRILVYSNSKFVFDIEAEAAFLSETMAFINGKLCLFTKAILSLPSKSINLEEKSCFLKC